MIEQPSIPIQASATPEEVYWLALAPDEFDELLGAYEEYVQCCQDVLDERSMKLAQRVLAKLLQADAAHICVDEAQSDSE